jgi:vacuolar-type H+-ATPase subunit H
MKTRIQEVLDIEKQAQDLLKKANAEAEELPIRAEREADALVEKTRTDARAEAERLVAEARQSDPSAAILAQTEEQIGRAKTLAMSHRERAVRYVLNILAGKKAD